MSKPLRLGSDAKICAYPMIWSGRRRPSLTLRRFLQDNRFCSVHSDMVTEGELYVRLGRIRERRQAVLLKEASCEKCEGLAGVEELAEQGFACR
jgi:hypothetical protein